MNEFIVGRKYRALKDNYFRDEKIVSKGEKYKAITYNTLLVGDSEFFMPDMKDFDISFELVSYKELTDELIGKKEVIDNLKNTTPSYAKAIESKDSDFTKSFINANQLNRKMSQLINESYANLHDMPWSERLQEAPQYERINMQGEIAALKIKNELAEKKYNQLRKENIKLSRDYDELQKIVGLERISYYDSENGNKYIVSVKSKMTSLESDISYFQNEVINLNSKNKNFLSEIEDYKKTIKSFESDRNDNSFIVSLFENQFKWLMFCFVFFALFFLVKYKFI